MEKAFDFAQSEERAQDTWRNGGGFADGKTSAEDAASSYSIVMPPPNVTGVLHMGHLLNNTLQDILIRMAMQRGAAALWQCGTDHAGISMQSKVEKELLAKGLDPKKMPRETFLGHAERWRDSHGNIILAQLMRLGVCCDFKGKVHTLDVDYARTVLHGFVKLYRRGHIYRGRRMVHWCPQSKTALSDEEVLTREIDGFLWRVRYALADGSGRHIDVCTTRPETIGGDVAIAVNPNDPRHGDLVGCRCWRPFPREQIPIVADGSVDMTFGTGALKITPSHSAVDFEIGQRHGLPLREVMLEDGTMNALAGDELVGLDRAEARLKSVEVLRGMGCLISEEPHRSAVGIGERSGVPVEPRLSEQWFLRYPSVELAMRAVEGGHIRFFPDHWKKTYSHWLNNIHDWCISRQLLWGHRIPVWYRRGEDRTNVENLHVSVDGPGDEENWERDSDVLDTWFSSAFWPLGTLGWPDQKRMAEKGFSKFFPTDVLVTGPDIIFFWVARMVTMSLAFLGENVPEERIGEIVPFRDVCLSGIVRDERGRKMSKSLGNSPDPIGLIDRYGADSVRFGLIAASPLGQDILFDEKSLELGRNFCSKLWNACRFRSMQGPANALRNFDAIAAAAAGGADFFDRCILDDLAKGLGESRKLLKSDGDGSASRYDFQGSLHALVRFFRDDFCDFYVELCKWRLKKWPIRKNQTLAVSDLILRTMLQSLSPFVPFITQELWQQLQFGQPGEVLQRVPLPDLAFAIENLKASPAELERCCAFRSLLQQLRSTATGRTAAVLLLEKLPDSERLTDELSDPLIAMVGCKSLQPIDRIPLTLQTVVSPWGRLALAVGEAADGGKMREELAAVRRHIAANRAKLDDEEFLRRAPAHVVDGAQKLLAENLETEEQLASRLDAAGQFSTDSAIG
ncbi:MAG: valine--tRNA ligase [Puniceicoccales bacterium]|jgi:valyl-tRNA synthetase|nr:valine--tRNA ligase [Puniceicoccales bacterium]